MMCSCTCVLCCVVNQTQLIVAHLLATHERALVLTESNAAARHLCELLSAYVGSDECGLFLGEEVGVEWEETVVDVVRTGGYLVDQVDGEDDGHGGVKGSNRRIMLTTVSYAFALSLQSPHLFFPRPLLIFDDANAIWLVKALLLLRFLTSTERMLVVGDSGGLTPSLCKDIHHPLSLLSQLTILAQSHHLHSYHQHRSKAFTILHAHLSIEHRMVKHVTSLISTVFYPSNPLISLDEPTGERNVFWRDSRGTAMRADNSKSVLNVKECEEVIRLYLQLEREGWKRDEIALLCFYDAQQEAILEHGGRELGCRVYLVEQFAGRETDCVIVSLASEFLTPTLSDRYRINVACSRARQRLYIVGNRITLARVEGHWKQISEFEQREPMRKAQVVPDLVADFPSLGAAVSGATDNSTAATSTGGSQSGSGSAVLTSVQPPHASPKAPANRVSGGGLAWSSLLAANSTAPPSSASFPAVHHEEEDDHSSSGQQKHISSAADQSQSHDASLPDGADKWGQNGGFYWKKTASSAISSPSSHANSNHTAANIHQQQLTPSANMSYSTSSSSSSSSAHRQPAYHPNASPHHGPAPTTPLYKPSSSFASLPSSSPSLSAYPSPDDPTKPFRWRTSLCLYYTKGACQNGANCNFAHGEWEVRSLQQATNAHAQWNREQQLAAGWTAAGLVGMGGMQRGGQIPQSPKQQQFALPPQSNGGFGAFSPSSLSSLSLSSPTNSIYSPMRSSPLHSGRAGGGAGMPAFASLTSPLSVPPTSVLSPSGFSATSAIFSPSSSASLFTPPKSSLLATSAVFTPISAQAASISHTSTTALIAGTTQPSASAATSAALETSTHDSKAKAERRSSDVDDAGWECRCTLVNAVGADKCEACDSSRPTVAAATETDSVWKSVTGKKSTTPSLASIVVSPPAVSATAAAASNDHATNSKGTASAASKPSVTSLTGTTSITTSNGHTIKILSTTPASLSSSPAGSTPQMRRTNSGTPSLSASAVASTTPPAASSASVASAAASVTGKPAAAAAKKSSPAATNAGAATSASSASKEKGKDASKKADKATTAAAADDKKADKGSDSTTTTASSPSSSFSSSAKPWTCPQCTYANDSSVSRCEMCETERKDEWKPVTTGKKAAAGSSGGGSGGGGVVVGGVGGVQTAAVVMNNPFAAVMNGHGSGSKRKGR